MPNRKPSHSFHLSCFVLACVLSPVLLVSAQDRTLPRFEHHPDIEITLWASEPLVIDPVALDFAADGDCYVVEMRDYPYGFGAERDPGGTVRLLRDTDGDGRADFSSRFAEDLSFPTSVMAWRHGVLVIAPPQILFLADADGDGQSDERRVVLDGLQLGVTDANANSLTWTSQNLIHAANGGNGGALVWPGGSGEPFKLDGWDFAFQIEDRRIVRTGRTTWGFGLVFDDWGDSFCSNNIDYFQQRFLSHRYVAGREDLPRWELTHNVSDHGESARLFPIVEAQTRVNHPEQAGHFSSAGGMGRLVSSAFSERLVGSVFVCDVVSNLIHRNLLYPSGPTHRVRRAPEEERSEFVASRDPAFRPTGVVVGPDGALYVPDMQRDVIEHPDYIPAKVLEHLDIRAGDDRGRIYRIVPRGGLEAANVDLTSWSTAQLAAALASGNSWLRNTAHRRLYEERPPDLDETLRRDVLPQAAPIGRIRALWLLDANRTLTNADVENALSDDHFGVRRHALLLAERRRDGTGAEAVVARLSDEHPTVRFQAALTVSLLAARTAKLLDALEGVLLRDLSHEWSRRAVYTAAKGDAPALLRRLWAATVAEDKVALRRHALEELAEVAAASLDSGARASMGKWLGGLSPRGARSEDFTVVLRGLHRGWERSPKTRFATAELEQLLERWGTGSWGTGASMKLAAVILDLYGLDGTRPNDEFVKRVRAAAATVLESEREEALRVGAIETLGRLRDEATGDLLLQLLRTPQTTAVQAATVAALRRQGRDELGDQLVAGWDSLVPGVRRAVIDVFLSRRQYQEALLRGLESEALNVLELNLDLEQRRSLLRWSTPEIGKRATKFWGDEEYSNRKVIVEEWLEKLPARGDAGDGKETFVRLCATCHRAGDVGHAVGPDLAGVSHRSVEDLLGHIVDPNMGIEPKYVACFVRTEDGQLFTGLLSAETSEHITLLMADAKTETILRSDIAEFRTLKTSLMPEGLEQDLTPLQMRSLITFLQEGSAP